MDTTTTGEKPRRSPSFAVLTVFFLLACVLAWFVLQDAGQNPRTWALVYGILVSAFLALAWFNVRLARQSRSLQETETQLASTELEARSAHALLLAKQGVEQAMAELSTYIRAIDHHAIVSVADRSGRIVQVNDKFVEISGYSREELLGQDHRIINSGTHGGSFFAQMWSTIASGEIWRGVICNRAKSGKLYWVDSAIVPLRDAAGGVVRYLSIRIDITERKQAEQEMLHIATHDGLTGLPNRTLLVDRIRQALVSDRRAKALAAVLFIDLDQFKTINDSLGHEVGDLLLIEVGRRLSACMRSEDTVARQGGDEFIVLLPRLADAAGAGVLADKLLKSLLLPFQVGDMELHIGASIGIAVFPGDGEDVETLLKNSDTAMYQAKESGRNNVMFFTPQMNQSAVERYALTTDLRRALERDELLLNFQPIVNTVSGEMSAMEVLLRWEHPVRGRVPPLQFVPLAEASGLIVPIGEWVLRSACLQIKAWQARGLRVPRLAINLSAVQFRTRSIFDTVSTILQETDTAPGALELEITEGVLMANTDEVVAALTRLNDMGVRIAIDDFGTGYSSLSYLKRLPIDTLKIDRSFVMDLADDPDDEAIVTAILALAHSLKMKVVAEGVENEAQRSFLREHGCDQCQGYLFSQPLSAEGMEALLQPV